MIVDAKTLCEVYNVDRRTVTNWLNEEPPCPSHMKGRKRQFDTSKVAAWRESKAETRGEESAGRRPPADYEDAKARKLSAEAKLAELELAQKESELIPMDVHESRLATICDRLRAKLLNLPGKAAPHLVGRRSVQEALLVLEPAVAEAMQALVDTADEIEADAAAHEQADDAA